MGRDRRVLAASFVEPWGGLYSGQDIRPASLRPATWPRISCVSRLPPARFGKRTKGNRRTADNARRTLRKNRSSARGAKTKSWEKWGMKRGSLTSDSTTRHEPQSYSQSHRIDLYQDANIRRPVRSALPPLVRSLDSYSTLYGLLLGDQARTCSKPARFLSHCPRHSRAPQATPRRRRPRLPQ